MIKTGRVVLMKYKHIIEKKLYDRKKGRLLEFPSSIGEWLFIFQMETNNGIFPIKKTKEKISEESISALVVLTYNKTINGTLIIAFLNVNIIVVLACNRKG